MQPPISDLSRQLLSVMTVENYARADLENNLLFCKTLLEFIVTLIEEHLRCTFCGRLELILFNLTGALVENLYWLE